MSGNVSLIESLEGLPEEERLQILAEFTDAELRVLEWDWPSWARASQLEPPGDDWHVWLVLAGRGFGKTRMGAEWVREQVKSRGRVNLIGKDATDLWSIMIEGESGIMACCPKHEKPRAIQNKRRLEWPNGSVTEWRSGEDPDGVRGLQHEALWCDELAAWQYVDDTWNQAMLGLRSAAGASPRVLVTTTPKPIPLLRDLISRPHVHVTKGSSYENRPNLAPVFFDQVIKPYEGTRLGRQEIDAELLLDEGLAYAVIHGVHIVPDIEIPQGWRRFECMDFGSSAPTAWLPVASDYDGNLVVFDEFYEPGLPSETAPKILARRPRWEAAEDGWGGRNIVYADSSVFDNTSVSNQWGRPATIAEEFQRAGIVTLTRSNKDRRAGYIRISELLRRDEAHRFPAWHPLRGEPFAPRVFFAGRCVNLIQQLRDAPLEDPDNPLSKLPGEAVDAEWEGRHGHAHAALRYGVMSRPGPSELPPKPVDDPREEHARRMLEQIRSDTGLKDL